jgi:hypothetical protein
MPSDSMRTTAAETAEVAEEVGEATTDVNDF